MRDVLSNVLFDDGDSDIDGTNRILAAAFFRKRPLQAGSSPCHDSVMSPLRATYAAPATSRANNVVRLADRRPTSVSRADQMLWPDETNKVSRFLGGGK